MRRLKQFTFTVNDRERALIYTLAERLQRSQSDAVRFVVVNAARELEFKSIEPATNKPEGAT
jgi:hypothetical protein